jgi:acyl carrier protein
MIHSATLLSAENIKVLCIAISSETRRKYDVTDVEVPFGDLFPDSLAIMNVLEIVEDRTGIELPASFFFETAPVSPRWQGGLERRLTVRHFSPTLIVRRIHRC